MKNKQPHQNPRITTSTVVVIVFILVTSGLTVFAVCWLSQNRSSNGQGASVDSAESLIVPRVIDASRTTESLSIGQRKKLEEQLDSLIEARKSDGTISRAGIWFRDLQNGPILEIDGDAKFSPASLLKLPLALWFYRQGSTTPDYLEQEIQFTGPKGESIQHFIGNETLEVGHVYTIRELIRIMLEDSDNDATAILGGIAGITNTDSVYDDLGIERVTDYNTYVIDVHTYASFLRILYNASYVSRHDSQEILTFLSQSTFSQGLVQGVSSTTTVAHKFGERVIDEEKGLYQLHDCGIIYARHYPYVLCVMSQGRDYDKLASFISEVSKITSDSVGN